MSETAPTVALLFDDTELGGQLREALHERGARIVHEGGMASLDLELLQRVDAEVLVVNLDEGSDDALDRLYDVIDGDRPRVVFNDGQASRALAGWDRARWARHLAAKVLATVDIDPPRPSNARAVDTPLLVASSPVPMDAPATNTDAEIPPSVEIPVLASTAQPEAGDALEWLRSEHGDDIVDNDEHAAGQDSENLAAELEALLASGELPSDEDFAFAPEPHYGSDDELLPLPDGLSSMDALTSEIASGTVVPPAVAGTSSGDPASIWQIDHLQLDDLDDAAVTLEADAAHLQVPVDAMAKQAISAPESWALVGDDVALDDALGEQPDAKVFGLEKLSAADYLAPDVEQVAPDIQPRMSLELVSMEEAIAPQSYVHQESEMSLDELGNALSRVVLLGAAVEGAESARAFLAALPASTRLTFLYTQYLGGQSVAALAERLRDTCALPVRLAVQGQRAMGGEVVLVPAGQQVHLLRDGAIQLQPYDADAPGGASIDANLTMAAGVFGRDALAIIFSGQANDAVAGAQAIHDRGGQVWVESSPDAHSSDMVSGIFAERLVSFSGTSQELAAHLIEVFP